MVALPPGSSASSQTCTGVASPVTSFRLVAPECRSADDTSSVAQAGEDDPSRAAAQEWVIGTATKALGSSTIASDREAACVWLCSLVQFCGPWSPRLRSALPDLQEVLSSLLGEASPLASETASRATAMAYRLGEGEAREALVEKLTQVLSGKSKPGATKVRLQDC